jgi:murein DD-endopeptidase MepM/ murein hydrolase activator NlpD
MGATEPLEIRVRAREIAPGDPVRVDVASRLPLAQLSGSFLGRGLSFVRRDDGRGQAWSAWTLVDLDTAAGPAVVEVHGTTAGGEPAAGTLAVRVEPREFAREELTVAPDYVAPKPAVQARLERERARLAEVYRERLPVLPRGPFVAPVPGEPTSAFGTRRVYNGEPRAPHPGLDLRAATGTPVTASGAGEVRLATELYWSGNTVIVDHGAGLFTIYAHLDTIEVREGDRVEAGRRIGRSGATGRVTGPHLHWGAKIGELPFDPTALLDPALFD